MLTRNDQPYTDNFNFGTDSVFNCIALKKANSNILTNAFLLLDSPLDYFLLLDGTVFLLLGS
jgi:hypothetical protein